MKILVNKKEVILLKNKLLQQMDEIYNEIDYLERLKDSFIWQGKAYRSFIIKYDDNLRDLKNRMDVLMIYIKFLDAVINNYGGAMDEIMNEYNRLRENIYG